MPELAYYPSSQEPCLDMASNSDFCMDAEECVGARHCQPTQRMTQKLNALKPTPLVPCRLVTHRPHAVDALKRIESLEVTTSDHYTDRTMYSINIYQRNTQSRIPVHGQFARSSSLPTSSPDHHTKPSVSIHVAYEDLVQLRNDAYELARSSHMMDVCPFCKPMMFLNMSSDFRPRWNSHWHKTKDQVAEMLTTYLNLMLQLAGQVPTSGDDHCYAQQQIPQMLERFLQPSVQERNSE